MAELSTSDKLDAARIAQIKANADLYEGHEVKVTILASELSQICAMALGEWTPSAEGSMDDYARCLLARVPAYLKALMTAAKTLDHRGTQATLDEIERYLKDTASLPSHALRSDPVDVALADKIDSEAAKLRAMKEDRGDPEYWLLRLFLDNQSTICSALRGTRSAKQHAVGFEKWMSYQLYYEQNTGSFTTDSQRYYTADQMRAAWEAGVTGNLEKVARYFETRYAHVNDSKWIAKEIRDLMRSPERMVKDA